MKPGFNTVVLGCALTAVSLTPTAAAETAGAAGWRPLEAGLELGVFSAEPSSNPDSLIRVLRIDPDYFEFELFNASADDITPLTPKQWARAKGLTASINASMFQQDLLTSVSLMRRPGHVNNGRLSKDRAILGFGPVKPGLPPVKIIDRECDDFEALKDSYKTLVQSIRMVSCTGDNVWRPRDEKWSTSAIAIDDDGNVLFIHAEEPFATHDLIDALMALPLRINRAMYVEGGPQAQMYVTSEGEDYEFTGHLSSILQQGAKLAWPIPNVIGITPKTSSTSSQPVQ